MTIVYFAMAIWKRVLKTPKPNFSILKRFFKCLLGWNVEFMMICLCYVSVIFTGFGPNLTAPH